MKLGALLVLLAASGYPSTTSAFAPSAVRTFTVLSSLNDPTSNTGKNNNAAPLTRPFSSTDAASAATSVISQPEAPPSSEATNNNNNENPYKVYKLPPTTPSLISIPTVASVMVATVGTFVLNNYLNLGPIQASGIAGLVASLVLPNDKLALAALCGSFAGMAKHAVIPGGIAASAILGALCAFVLALFDHKKWLIGMGGRLGFIAQCACTTQFIIMRSLLMMGSAATAAEPAAAALVGTVPSWSKVLRQLPQVTAFTVLGALFMKYWKEFFAKKTSIPRLSTSAAAVGATGVVASLLLPASLAGPAFCGSFVTMSAPTKLPTLLSLIGASALAGVSQQAMAGIMLGGWGGRLGTAAFLGVLSYTLLNKSVISNKSSSIPPPSPPAPPSVKAESSVQVDQSELTDDSSSTASTSSTESAEADTTTSSQETNLPENLRKNYL